MQTVKESTRQREAWTGDASLQFRNDRRYCGLVAAERSRFRNIPLHVGLGLTVRDTRC